jgi:hypothetical protein
MTRREWLAKPAAALAWRASGQVPQNPSPMVEHARTHPRLAESEPQGERHRLELGTLFLPVKLKRRSPAPLLVHFHGAPWIVEVSAAKLGKTALISVTLGQGSAVYAKPFADVALFGRMLEEGESKSGLRFGQITISHWSAGYGSAREILRQPRYYDRVDRLLAIDSIHAGYVSGKPGPRESELVTDGLEIFLRFARDAGAGRKQMILTHSEIFPGTYASTTETAEYLLRATGLRRRPVLRWGPMGMQQLSEARGGKLLVLGYAGNSGPDHVDQLHALADLVKLFR